MNIVSESPSAPLLTLSMPSQIVHDIPLPAPPSGPIQIPTLELTPPPLIADSAPCPPPRSSTILSLPADVALEQMKLTAMGVLITKYGQARISKHKWEWVVYRRGKREAEWVPKYRFTADLDLRGIWDEYDVGLDGCFSTRELTNTWETAWRVDTRTEHSRRKKVTDLIEELSKKTHWNVRIVFQFLGTQFPINPLSSEPTLRSSRKFIEGLQCKDGKFRQRILDEANSYKPSP
jgi:hypothetical protein